jgi:GT2 family glycosyltransferase
MEREPLVVAILTCHDRRERTLRALRSWFDQEDGAVRLAAVLVDDGSTDETAAAVAREFPAVDVVPADGSLFWAAGMALAESHARRRDPNALFWLNDDVVLAPDCLSRLAAVSRAYQPDAVVAGAVADPDTGRPSYGAFEPSRWHPLRGHLVGPAGRPVPVGPVHGNVLYVPRAAYLRVRIDGGFRHAYADFDYGLRLRRIGHPVVLSPTTVGWCSRGSSSRGTPPRSTPLRRRLAVLNSPHGLPFRSHVRYLRRHGGPFWPLYAVHPYVKELVRTPAARLLGDGAHARGAR